MEKSPQVRNYVSQRSKKKKKKKNKNIVYLKIYRTYYGTYSPIKPHPNGFDPTQKSDATQPDPRRCALK
jgi:hypothetical protein